MYSVLNVFKSVESGFVAPRLSHHNIVLPLLPSHVERELAAAAATHVADRCVHVDCLVR